MLRFLRPPEPARFASAVAEARADVARAMAAGARPEFPELWRHHKRAFAVAQHNKCGYCEVILSATTGALDHHRPKARLEALPAERAKHGREVEGSSNVEGRELAALCESGYAWAAYAWDNYVLVCDRCNTGWKRCLFPVAESPRAVPPVEGGPETPLLLCPFEAENPAAHLLFDGLGQVVARDGSPRGQATIDTCGLWRPSLCAQRVEKAGSAYGLIVRLLDARTKDAEDAAFRDLQSAGAPDRAHAGMVRAIFEAEVGESWDLVFGLDWQSPDARGERS